MISLFNFLIEGSLILILLAAIYHYLFRYENQLYLRRILLLGIVLITIFIPFMDLKAPTGTGAVSSMFQESVHNLQSAMISDVSINPKKGFSTNGFHGTITYLLLISYFSGFTIIAIRLIIQLVKVRSFLRDRRFKKGTYKGFNLIQTEGILPTFSFWNSIFYNNKTPLEKSDKNQILDHEVIHLQQYHSLDTILMELGSAVFWFNPAIWYLRRETKIVHEYLADQEVTKVYNPVEYKSLLAKVTLSTAGISIGNYFNKSQTLKRIEMITNQNKRPSKWKVLTIFPLILGLSLVFSCNEDIIGELDTMNETLSQVEIPSGLKADYEKYERQYPSAKIMYAEVTSDNHETLHKIQWVDGNTILKLKAFEDKGTIGVIFIDSKYLKGFKTVTVKDSKTSSDGEIFTIVDDPAMPEGGYAAFYKYVAENMKYPEQAKNMGIEGRVFIQFVVDTDGSVTEVQPIKGIGGGCDEEAVRVVKEHPNWIPPLQNGVVVKQRIVLPINFKLKNNPGN